MQAARLPPLPPIPWPAPQLEVAARDRVVQVMRHDGITTQQESVYLMRGSGDNSSPQLAYRRLFDRPPIPLGAPGRRRGSIVFGMILPRVVPPRTSNEFLLFREPFPSTQKQFLVVIKKIKRPLVDAIVAAGGNENAYNEIAAMRALAAVDDHEHHQQHVMPCIEALADARYLYIVMPFMAGGDLHARRGLAEPEARRIFQLALESIQYLQDQHVCHRDVKGQNFVTNNTNHVNQAIVIDLAMSLIVPTTTVMQEEDVDGVQLVPHVHMIQAQGTAGTLPFMPPEIFTNADYFDGFAVDIWSLAIFLVWLLMGNGLYDVPTGNDLHYQHFILHDGLINEELNHKFTSNERLAALIQSNHPHYVAFGPLLQKIERIQRLNPMVRDLLQQMLQTDPTRRITIQGIQNHPWVLHMANTGE